MSDPDQTRKDPKFIAAAILIALIAVAGIILAGIYAFSADDKTTPPSGTTTQQDSSSSACGLPDGSQTVPTDAPKTKWYFIGKAAAPESKDIGPGKKTDNLSTCFARSPAGALFAAATLLAETYPEDDAATAAAKARIIPNAALEDSLQAPSKGNRFPSQIVAYKFVDYTADRASLTIASRLTDGPQAGGLGSLTMTMVWRQGDWWWELQPSTSAVAISSLAGFVRWSAVS